MKILRSRPAVCFAAALLPALTSAFAAEVATAPSATTRSSVASTTSTAPATQSAADIQRWFEGLADADANVRDESTAKLLALTREDLPVLQKIVAATRQLALTQTTALHDIVVHVFLSGETYEANWGQGFLGLMQNHELSNDSVVVKLPEELAGEVDASTENGAPQQERRGVPVGKRLAGFCGYGALRTGDVVLAFSITISPHGELGGEARPDSGKGQEFTRDLADWFQLTQVVQQIPGGTRVEFHVLRQGRMLRIPIVLSPRPLWASPGVDFEPILLEREEKSEDYWNKVFAPLVAETVS